MVSKVTFSIQESTYVVKLLDLRVASLQAEKEVFNSMDYSDYEKALIRLLKAKCNVVIKDYTRS